MPAPILHFEDDLNSATLTARQLERGKIRNPVEHHFTASEGIVFLETAEPLPCLVLLDLGLPDMHGIDVIKYIRKHERAAIQDLCIFVLTVSDDQQTIAEIIQIGADAFLSKNLNIGKFLAAAQECGVHLDIHQ